MKTAQGRAYAASGLFQTGASAPYYGPFFPFPAVASPPPARPHSSSDGAVTRWVSAVKISSGGVSFMMANRHHGQDVTVRFASEILDLGRNNTLPRERHFNVRHNVWKGTTLKAFT